MLIIIRSTGGFYMLQLTSVSLAPLVNGKDHRHLLIKSAHHSFPQDFGKYSGHEKILYGSGYGLLCSF